MRTRDGGRTWHEMPTPGNLGTSGSSTRTSPSSRPSTSGAPHHQLIPRVLRTTDGGEHWQLSSFPASLRGTPRDLFFADDANGWLVLWNAGPKNRSALLRTTDGGATWQVIPTGPRRIDTARSTLPSPVPVLHVGGGRAVVRVGQWTC